MDASTARNEFLTGLIQESSTISDISGFSTATVTANGLQFIRTAIATIYVVIFIAGFLGNGMILFMFLRMKLKSRKFSVTDLYILNLAGSDFLFILNTPFAAIDMAMGGIWIFGGCMCKIFMTMGYLSMCVGVLIVMAMSIDRFQSVVLAVKMRKIRTQKRAKRYILVIWIFAMIYVIPAAKFSGAWETPIGPDNTTNCRMKFENISTLSVGQVVLIHTLFRFVVAFLVPFVVMVFCNVTIVHFLRKRAQKKLTSKANNAEGRKRVLDHMKGEKRVTRLILLVTTVFLVCFFPNLVLNALWVMGDGFRLLDVQRTDYYSISIWFSVCLLHLNSALNPFLYALSGSGYRKRIKENLFWFERKIPQASQSPENGVRISPHTAETRVHAMIKHNDNCHTKPLKTFVAAGSGEKTDMLLRQEDKSSDTDGEIPCDGSENIIAVEEQST